MTRVTAWCSIAVGLAVTGSAVTGCRREAAPLGGASAPATAAVQTQTGVVTAVIDGDTIRVRIDGIEHRIRLIGINSSELAHDGRPAQCGGQAARRYADRLLYRQTVTLTTDPREDRIDRYGRRLRYVAVDGKDASLQLLRTGHATEYHPRSARSEQRLNQYVAAQQSAQHRQVGQWATCRLDQVTKAPPEK